MFSEREAKLVGTSDFVVTKGYVQIRVVGFPWETASLEAVVRRQDGALLFRRERAEARLWVYRRLVGGRQRIDGVSSKPCVRGDALSQGQFCNESPPVARFGGARGPSPPRDRLVNLLR